MAKVFISCDMMTQSWFVLELKRALDAAGYETTTTTTTETSGNAVQSAVENIEGALAVLLCLSASYDCSEKCHFELQRAFYSKVRIIPLLIEPGYDPKDREWIKIMKISIIDFTNTHNFQSNVDQLLEELAGTKTGSEFPGSGKEEIYVEKSDFQREGNEEDGEQRVLGGDNSVNRDAEEEAVSGNEAPEDDEILAAALAICEEKISVELHEKSHDDNEEARLCDKEDKENENSDDEAKPNEDKEDKENDDKDNEDEANEGDEDKRNEDKGNDLLQSEDIHQRDVDEGELKAVIPTGEETAKDEETVPHEDTALIKEMKKCELSAQDDEEAEDTTQKERNEETAQGDEEKGVKDGDKPLLEEIWRNISHESHVRIYGKDEEFQATGKGYGKGYVENQQGDQRKDMECAETEKEYKELIPAENEEDERTEQEHLELDPERNEADQEDPEGPEAGQAAPEFNEVEHKGLELHGVEEEELENLDKNIKVTVEAGKKEDLGERPPGTKRLIDLIG